jgi:hypothetical protein
MTEAEWLACEDPGSMLVELANTATDRKMLLLAARNLRHTGVKRYRTRSGDLEAEKGKHWWMCRRGRRLSQGVGRANVGVRR